MKALPEKLLLGLEAVKGFERNAFIAAHDQAPVISVRLHPLKGSTAFSGKEHVPWCNEGRYLDERPVFTLDPLYHAGAYYVQEASSMFLDHVVRSVFPERKGLRVLDLCAAPGGKSSLLASLLDETSLLISNDVIRSRANILEENVVRWGYANNWVSCNDPRDFSALRNYFDLMVVDAPCSGSGLFRKDTHAVDAWSESNVQLCSQRQQRILADVWPALKEGGVLIYATCSYSLQEDEQILNWLAANFSVEDIEVNIPAEWGVEKSSADGISSYRFFPDKLKGEGFFIAALRKKEFSGAVKIPKYKTIHDKKAQQQSAYLLDKEMLCISPDRNSFNAMLQQHEADYHLLKGQLYFKKIGLPLGMYGQKEWVPAHEIALSVNRSSEIPFIELDKENALRFLKKEELNLPVSSKGWHLVTHQRLALGWLKSLGNRFNNYLPKSWRIRMELPD